MNVSGGWRAWFPIPTRDRGFELRKWLLLEGNRYAVTGALLSVSFATMLVVGIIWTVEIHQLLTETETVRTLLNTLLGGIILLVSIVVSINSIALSHQISSLSMQQERLEDALDFHQELVNLSTPAYSPTDPESFLEIMAGVLHERAGAVSNHLDSVEGELEEELEAAMADIEETADHLERSLDRAKGAHFGVLWIGLDTDFGGKIRRSHHLTTTSADALPDDVHERLERLVQSLEVCATGQEFFKTAYFNHEVSSLSRRLAVISLPAILVTASTILAINADSLPDVWILGLPPLLTVVVATFTVALSPFVVLVAHMLRLTTVSIRTSVAGPFVLRR